MIFPKFILQFDIYQNQTPKLLDPHDQNYNLEAGDECPTAVISL